MNRRLQVYTCVLKVFITSLFIVGFLLDKKIGVNQPKRIENAKILIANTGMDTDKIKVCDYSSENAVAVNF